MDSNKKRGNKNIILFSILFVITIVALLTLYIENNNFKNKLKFSGEDIVTIQVKYNGYACGNCYPQYRIDSVVKSENKESSFYLNKDINLYYNNAAIEKKLSLPDCSINCFYLIVSGNFESNQYGMLRIAVDDGNIKIDKDLSRPKKSLQINI